MTTEERFVESPEEVMAILARISFAPSCVDMGWSWEVASVADTKGTDSGWLIRTTFKRPDTNTGRVEIGKGRQWFVRYRTTESGLVKTAFAAAKMILEHELMEAFLVDGARVFDPHNTIAELASLQSGGSR